MIFSAIAGTLALAAEATTAIGATIGAGIGASAAGTGAAAGVSAAAGAAGAGAAAGGAAGVLSASTIQGAAALGGLGLSGAGLYNSMQGQAQVAEASQRAESIRQKQAELQAFRERREIIRRAQAARAIALANATSANAAESTALPGAYGQATGEATRGTVAVNENADLGAQIFGANRDIASGKQRIGTGTGLQDLGKQTMTASPQIGAIGATIFGSSSNYRPYGS